MLAHMHYSYFLCTGLLTGRLLDHDTSPLSGATLPNKALTPAIALRQLIAVFVADNPAVET